MLNTKIHVLINVKEFLVKSATIEEISPSNNVLRVELNKISKAVHVCGSLNAAKVRLKDYFRWNDRNKHQEWELYISEKNKMGNLCL